MCDYHGPSDEYKALRQELEHTTRFVFERPLLIISASLGALILVDKPFVAWLLPIAASLLVANLWFTADRMRSLSRIVAYIQVQLEEKTYKWEGWEVSLRRFRRWVSQNGEGIKDTAKLVSGDKPIPRAAGYYPTIYLMHLVAIGVTIGVATYLAINNGGWDDLSAAYLCSVPLLLCLYVAARYNPRKMANCIEETRAIWIKVLEEWKAEYEKPDAQGTETTRHSADKRRMLFSFGESPSVLLLTVLFLGTCGSLFISLARRLCQDSATESRE